MRAFVFNEIKNNHSQLQKQKKEQNVERNNPF